jgi:hypothetical protein
LKKTFGPLEGEVYIIHIERPIGSPPQAYPSTTLDIQKAISGVVTEAFGPNAVLEFRDPPKLIDTNYVGVLTRFEDFVMTADDYKTQVRVSYCPVTKKLLTEQLSEVEQEVGDTLSDDARALLTAFLLRRTA